MKLVSIIMPTFRNNGFELKRAVNSVINQTYSDWELIVIDDNEDDKFSEIVKQILFDVEDNRIVYLKNANNMGSAKTRNIGISMSKGEYITFLDDDDEYLSKKIEVQLNLMIETNADYSLTDLDLYNEDGKLVRKRRHSYLKENVNLLNMHLMYHLTGTDTFMFKKDYLIKIGMFDEIDSGDEFYLMLKAIKNNGIFAYLPKSFVKAYIHSYGIGITASTNREAGECILYENKKEYFNILNNSEISFIKMRHYLVLLSCGLREKNIYKILKNLFYSFFSNPIFFIKFTFNRKEY